MIIFPIIMSIYIKSQNNFESLGFHDIKIARSKIVK